VLVCRCSFSKHCLLKANEKERLSNKTSFPLQRGQALHLRQSCAFFDAALAGHVLSLYALSLFLFLTTNSSFLFVVACTNHHYLPASRFTLMDDHDSLEQLGLSVVNFDEQNAALSEILNNGVEEALSTLSPAQPHQLEVNVKK